MKEWKVEKNEFGKEYYELHFGEFYGYNCKIYRRRNK